MPEDMPPAIGHDAGAISKLITGPALLRVRREIEFEGTGFLRLPILPRDVDHGGVLAVSPAEKRAARLPEGG